jgi:hypothetical protein
MTMLGSDAVHTSFAGCIDLGTEKSTYKLLAKVALSALVPTCAVQALPHTT